MGVTGSTGTLPGEIMVGAGIPGFLVGGGASLGGAAGGNYPGVLLVGQSGPLVVPTDLAGATLDGISSAAADGSAVQGVADTVSTIISIGSELSLIP